MEQETKKKIAKGMISSGLIVIVLSGLGSFINRSEIERASQEKRRLLEYNNQTYSIALENPATYNQNVTIINDLEKQIRSYKESNKPSNLFLLGSSALAVGICFYPANKRQKN